MYRRLGPMRRVGYKIQEEGGTADGISLKCKIQEDWETLSNATSCK